MNVFWYMFIYLNILYLNDHIRLQFDNALYFHNMQEIYVHTAFRRVYYVAIDWCLVI